jgi:phage terminase small subunit
VSTEPKLSAYDSLPPKRRAFVDHYLKTNNATEAARLAGYASPNSQGPRLLLNVGVMAAIKERQAKVENKRLKKIQDYLLRLEELAFDGSNGPTQVAALKELLRVRDNSSPKEKQKSEERQARIAYLKAKTAEVAGGTDELGDVLIKWEDAKE